MKFWNVFLLIVLIAAPSLAQSSFYGYPVYGYGYNYGYNYYDPFYSYPPRNIAYPYTYPYSGYSSYGYPNFSPPITPYYLQPPYVAPPQIETTNTDLVIDDLQSDVRQLTDEVDRLENELGQAKNQPVQVIVPETPALQSAPEAVASRPPDTRYTMIFKDGRRIEAQGYVIVGETVWIVTPEHSIRAALSDLNIDATRKENLNRGIDFPIT